MEASDWRLNYSCSPALLSAGTRCCTTYNITDHLISLIYFGLYSYSFFWRTSLWVCQIIQWILRDGICDKYVTRTVFISWRIENIMMDPQKISKVNNLILNVLKSTFVSIFIFIILWEGCILLVTNGNFLLFYSLPLLIFSTKKQKTITPFRKGFKKYFFW